jgi:hypothetical protein
MSGENSEEAGLRCSRPSIGRIQYFINSIAVRTIGDALVVEENGFSGEVATCLQLRLEQEFSEGLQHSATGVLDAGCTCPISALSKHLRGGGTRRRILGVIIADNHASRSRYTTWPL